MVEYSLWEIIIRVAACSLAMVLLVVWLIFVVATIDIYIKELKSWGKTDEK